MAGRGDARSRSPQPYRFDKLFGRLQEQEEWGHPLWEDRGIMTAKNVVQPRPHLSGDIGIHPQHRTIHASHILRESGPIGGGVGAPSTIIACALCGQWMKDSQRRKLSQPCPGEFQTEHAFNSYKNLCRGRFPDFTRSKGVTRGFAQSEQEFDRRRYVAPAPPAGQPVAAAEDTELEAL